MDFSQLSEENYDIELSKVFAKLDKIVSPKELKKKKESLIVQLSESHALIVLVFWPHSVFWTKSLVCEKML
jgi:hypothetical protein